MQELDEIRLVVAMRTARAAVGWSQEELALQLGIAKTTIARAELMEGGLRVEQLTQIVRLYKKLGVDLDFMLGDGVTIKVDAVGLKQAQARLLDEAHRRADRKKSGAKSKSESKKP
jgi:transcriptional regulator with XRE-family HTH domain